LYKLEPGRIFYLDLAANNITEIKTYWSVASVIKRTSADDLREPSEIVNELEILLKRSISQQMLADVPIGAFLSGGIDSSTIVAIMQDLSDRPIRTFTIGFDSKKYNEAEHAKLVASYLKTDHTELYISGKETLDVIPSLAMSYSEPFGDSSQIPTTLVSKLARSKVTVALTGDAGDELFCGYKSYLIAENLRSNILKLPKWLRQCVYDINGWFSFASFSRSLSYKVDVAGKIFAADNDVDIYQRMISRTRKTDQYVLESTVDFNIGEKITDIQRQLEYIEKLMAIDLQMYLPDNNLCKVDRASMAFSLETRVPLLDHNIVDFAVNLPLKFKLYQGKSKWPLRQLLYRYVPQSIVERPKMGFSVPLSEWLSGPLRAWAESLLAKDKLVEQGYLNADLVKKTWHDHISRRRNNSHLLWNIIMFQSWLEIRKQKIS
jgi:asparagine synthase (glutamine-hydrolysing)